MSRHIPTLVCLSLMATLRLTAAPPPSTLSNQVFTAFDVETTGLYSKHHYIIEIGAIQFQGTHIIKRGRWLIKPPINIPSGATRIHGIRDEDVALAKPFKEVYPDFETFCSNSVRVAHNASFDVRFLSAELKRNNMQHATLETLDSLPLFKRWQPDLESYSLTSLAKTAELSFPRAHRGDADADMLATLMMGNHRQWSTNSLLELRSTTRVYPKSSGTTPRK